MSGVMPLASHSLSQDPSEMTPINPRQGSPASPPPQSETPVSNGHDSPSPTPQRKTYDLAVLNLPKPKRKIVSTFIGTVSIIVFRLQNRKILQTSQSCIHSR